VLLTGQTYLRARADASRQVSFADLKPGMLVDVAGTDFGVGRGLQAREVAAEGIGKAGRHTVAGGPPARIPSRTLFVTARSAAFLPDGQTLAVLDAAGNLSLWSTTALKQVASAPPPADGRNFVAVSLDGRMVARDARSSTAGGTHAKAGDDTGVLPRAAATILAFTMLLTCTKFPSRLIE
jgi:hypothetical protein